MEGRGLEVCHSKPKTSREGPRVDGIRNCGEGPLAQACPSLKPLPALDLGARRLLPQFWAAGLAASRPVL